MLRALIEVCQARIRPEDREAVALDAQVQFGRHHLTTGEGWAPGGHPDQDPVLGAITPAAP
jgi:hypothetical protein